MLTGFAVMALGAVGLAFLHASILELECSVVPTMVGSVAVLIAMSNIIVLSVSPSELGIQTGMNQTLRNLGSAIGPVLAAAVTATFTTEVLVAPPPFPAVKVPAATGFVVLFVITALVALAGLILSLGLRNYRFRADGSRWGTPSAAGGSTSPPPAEGEGR
jgi:hypothetical protein